MTKGVKICIIFICIILAGAVVSLIFMSRPAASTFIEIVQDGDIIYTIDIANEKNKTIRIDSPDGGYNIVEIKDGQVHISEADCPDGTCMKTGYLRSEEIPIVCLPHRLVIRFKS